jgi:hypothetical protein
MSVTQGWKSLVSQAEGRPVLGEAADRTRQMGCRGRDHPGIARSLSDLGAGRLLHRCDQTQQPAPVGTARAANLKSLELSLKPLGHRFCIFRERGQPGIYRVVPTSLPQRNCGVCDLLHRAPFRSVVEVRDGPRNAPDDVGPAARYRDRLRLDRNRRGSRLDRTGLSHPHLRKRRQQSPHLSMGPRTNEKVQAAVGHHQSHC